VVRQPRRERRGSEPSDSGGPGRCVAYTAYADGRSHTEADRDRPTSDADCDPNSCAGDGHGVRYTNQLSERDPIRFDRDRDANLSTGDQHAGRDTRSSDDHHPDANVSGSDTEPSGERHPDVNCDPWLHTAHRNTAGCNAHRSCDSNSSYDQHPDAHRQPRLNTGDCRAGCHSDGNSRGDSNRGNYRNGNGNRN